jgi:hypothetical protein
MRGSGELINFQGTLYPIVEKPKVFERRRGIGELFSQQLKRLGGGSQLSHESCC